MSEPDSLIAGRYRLVRPIGTGGMGVVWEAWDERLRRPVAVKQLHPERGLSAAETELAISRAMREARITARLHHPHAVSVFDVVEHDGQPCLIMQFLPSKSLHTLLAERGRLLPTEVARIGAEVASALAAAHLAGIVHRDVKPGNILIADDGSAKISDFGISHAMGDVTLTSTGMVTGTPAYLAPEVARGGPSSFASDVFSLGATLYAALEGVPPFGTNQNPMALLHQVASGKVAPPRHGGALTPLLLRMLAAAPKDRPPMEEVALGLAAVDADPSVTLEDALPLAVGAPATQELESPAPPEPTSAAPVHALPTPPSYADGSIGDLPPDPVPPGDEPVRRRSRAGVLLVTAVLVLALAALAAWMLLGGQGTQNPTAQPGASPSRSPVPSSDTTTSTAGSAAPLPPVAAAPSLSTPSSPSTPTSPSPGATPPATQGSATLPPAAGVAPTGAALAQAMTDYYGLLPGNTDAGWARLTPRYQAGTAKSRQTYQAFWDGVQRVTVANVTGTAPGTVQATVTYVLKDGRVVQERTSYGLVRDGGVLKIDSSTVLSSQSR